MDSPTMTAVLSKETATNIAEGIKSSQLFPDTLHLMLEDAEKGFDDFVSWQPCGRAFKVHNVIKFSELIMPMYFNRQTRYKSFLRQLNIYGYQRLTSSSGSYHGAYAHEAFIRGMPEISKLMTRTKIKGTTKSQPSKSSSTKFLLPKPKEVYSTETFAGSHSSFHKFATCNAAKIAQSLAQESPSNNRVQSCKFVQNSQESCDLHQVDNFDQAMADFECFFDAALTKQPLPTIEPSHLVPGRPVQSSDDIVDEIIRIFSRRSSKNY
jgi:hypothetical protein